jgi:hypothetical protein
MNLCKMFNFVRIYGVREKNTRRNLNNSGQERKRQASSHLMPCPQARHIKTNKRQAQASRRDNMKNAKRILEKFDSWKYDIYENNKSDWTKQDDKDVSEIEKLLEQQASEQKG